MIHDATLPEQMLSWLRPQGVVVFLFHGVIEKQKHYIRNYTGKHLTRELFEVSIARLVEKGNAISMNQILDLCNKKKSFPPYSFAVTFDDGFENNLTVAGPILSCYGVPAMVYLATGFVEENRMSWIDQIERAVEDTEKPEASITGLGGQASLKTRSEKIKFLELVRKSAKNDPTCDPENLARLICAELGDARPSVSEDPIDKKMNWKQVKKARAEGIFEFGGHSHRHAILSFLSEEQLANELDTSLGLLKSKAGIGSKHYSYPEGLAHCFNDRVIAELKHRGVQCCPTALQGINMPGTDPFHLFRVQVA